MAKRRRKTKRHGKVRFIMILALILIIAGFVTRRVFVPGALNHLRHFSSSRKPGSREYHAGENLTNQDRQALDSVVRSRAH